jgi:hypothetical protein
MNPTYELRDDPDALPIGPIATCAEAERRGRKISHKRGWPILIYEVTDHGERCLGEC